MAADVLAHRDELAVGGEPRGRVQAAGLAERRAGARRGGSGSDRTTDARDDADRARPGSHRTSSSSSAALPQIAARRVGEEPALA